MSTILDVAKLAGVSRSTASRVISGKGSVKPATRKAVEDAIKELNYTPSYFAQGIKAGKSRVLAMMIPDYSNLFYTEMYRGIEKVALKNNYMVMICNTDKSSSKEIFYTEELLKRKVDGIVYNTYKRNDSNIKYFIELSKKIPIVFMDHLPWGDEKVSYVLTEGFESSKNAVKYLVSTGKKRIGYIRLPPYVSVTNHRYEGYCQGLRESGIEPDEKLVYECSHEEITKTHLDIGYDGAKALMEGENPPDSIMTAADIIAIGVIKYLKQNGYEIPGDVSVLGFDDIPLSTIVEPNITTIAQPTTKIGEEAAKILINKINGKKNSQEQIVFKPELIIRQST